MKALMTIFSTMLMASSVYAADSAPQKLIGTWKLEKSECKSGAPRKTFSGGQGGSLKAEITFTQSEYATTVNLTIKADISQNEEGTLKQIENAKKMWETVPDSAEKQKGLAELERIKAEILALIEKYKNGQTCTVEAIGTYRVTGTEILTKPLSTKNSCQESTYNGESTAQFEIQDNILRVTSQPYPNEGATCPQGDSSVEIFSRTR